MGTKIPKDMPCQRDCPDRYPGCLCDKKRAWDEQKEARKKAIRDMKDKETAIHETLRKGRNKHWKEKIR